MKIRTQLIASAVVLALILLACSFTLWIGDQRLQRISAQEELARSLQQDANELGFITNSYLLFRDNSQLTLWQSKTGSITSELTALKSSNQQQQNLIDDMKANQLRLAAVFTEIKTGMENSPTTTENLDYVGTAYSRLAVQTLGIVSNANQLLSLLQNEYDQIRQRNILVIFGLLGFYETSLGNYRNFG